MNNLHILRYHLLCAGKEVPLNYAFEMSPWYRGGLIEGIDTVQQGCILERIEQIENEGHTVHTITTHIPPLLDASIWGGSYEECLQLLQDDNKLDPYTTPGENVRYNSRDGYNSVLGMQWRPSAEFMCMNGTGKAGTVYSVYRMRVEYSVYRVYIIVLIFSTCMYVLLRTTLLYVPLYHSPLYHSPLYHRYTASWYTNDGPYHYSYRG